MNKGWKMVVYLAGITGLAGSAWLSIRYPSVYWILSLIAAGLLHASAYQKGFDAGRHHEIEQADRRARGILN